MQKELRKWRIEFVEFRGKRLRRGQRGTVPSKIIGGRGGAAYIHLKNSEIFNNI